MIPNFYTRTPICCQSRADRRLRLAPASRSRRLRRHRCAALRAPQLPTSSDRAMPLWEGVAAKRPRRSPTALGPSVTPKAAAPPSLRRPAGTTTSHILRSCDALVSAIRLDRIASHAVRPVGVRTRDGAQQGVAAKRPRRSQTAAESKLQPQGTSARRVQPEPS